MKAEEITLKIAKHQKPGLFEMKECSYISYGCGTVEFNYRDIMGMTGKFVVNYYEDWGRDKCIGFLKEKEVIK